MLKTAALGAGGVVLAACTQATPQVIKETVVVEKEKQVEVTKEVEKQVEVTKEVEKVVEQTVQVEVTSVPGPGATQMTVWGSGLDLTQMEKDPKGAGLSLNTHKELWQAKHPDMKLIWEDHGWDEVLRQNVTTALLAGTQPDVPVGENFFQQYASLGAMLPLDDVITPEITDNSITGTHKAAIFQGKTYGLSWFSGCFGFEINPTVFKDAGLEAKVPADWDEMLQVAKTMTEKGGKKFYGYTLQGPQGFSQGGMFRLAVYMQQLGVTLNKPDEIFYPNFNDPAGYPVWEFIRKILPYTPPGLVLEPDEGKVYSQLFANKSGMQMAGSWHVSWAKSSGLANAMYGTVPVAPGGKPASYVVGNVLYGALSQSKAPDAAKDWIMLGQDKGLQDTIFHSTTRLPSTKSGVASLTADTTVDDATKLYGTMLRDADLGILPQWNKEPNKLNSIWNDLFLAVVTTNDDIAGIADDAQKKADEVMKA